MVLDSILPSSSKRSPSLRRHFTRYEVGTWSILLRRHQFLLSALALLSVLCTVYLYFAVTLGSREPCSGLSGPQKASCHMEHLKTSIAKDNPKKISHLVELKSLGELNIIGADLTVEEDFDAPVAGCELVFQLATPVNFASEDPEPAIKGVLNVLKACARAKVKRVILTSSTAAVTINELDGTGLVMDESNWTDVEYLSTAKPHSWGYPASKAQAERAAWKFAEENHIDLITVIPTLTAGPSLTPDVPTSVGLATSLITGHDFFFKALRGMQLVSGSISITHVEDVCRAHIFVAEKESASGRYICCAHNTSVPELAKFLSKRYPQYKIQTEFDDIPSKAKSIISSDKLIKEGFNYKYGIEEIFDQTVEYLKTKGGLKN